MREGAPAARHWQMRHAYWGPGYSDDEIEALLKWAKVRYRALDDVARDTAAILAQDRIIGWFQGRMEFGPRALGARSILASPLSPSMQARLNELKDREDFRPVAPVVPVEDLGAWFTPAQANRGEAPFMLFLYDVRPEKAALIPTVCHADRTARVQAVARETNPRYHDTLKAFEALTGARAVEYLQQRDAALEQTTSLLGVPADQAPDAISKLQSEAKRLARENEQLKMKLALGGGGAGTSQDEDTFAVGDAKLIARHVTGLEKPALRSLSDSLRDRLKRGVVVLAADDGAKVHLLVSVTKDLTDRVSAGQLVKELAPIVGGGGGGRADFAEAGGKDPARIGDLLTRARERVSQLMG